jgi:hypothetical protein
VGELEGSDMTDKLIGAFILVIVLALVAVGSLATYQMFGTNNQTPDSFGTQFSNKTNATVNVEQKVAPVSIQLNGWLVLLAVVFVIVGAAALMFKWASSGKHGSGRGMR